MKEIQLVAGDSVVFLSDGLIDAMNGDGEILGIEKIVDLPAHCPEKSQQELLRMPFSFVEAYAKRQPQQDDRTAAVLRYL